MYMYFLAHRAVSEGFGLEAASIIEVKQALR
jgi:hypothetical protein